MSDRRKEIADNLAKLSLIEDALQEMYRNNQETIQSLSWQNRRITGSIRDVRFAKYMYGSLTDAELDSIPKATFPGLMAPLTNLLAAGDGYRQLKDRTTWVHDNVSEIASSVSAFSAVIYASTGDTATNIMDLDPFVTTVRFASAITKYLEEVRVDEELVYIKTEVAKLDPRLSDEFQHFLDNYFASEPSMSKYQELIGSRSLFFQRAIFSDAEKRGISAPTHSRREQIEAFVYGGSIARDPSIAAALSVGENLWKELSSQDVGGMSVKTGNVTPAYVQLIFNKTIIVFSTLLKQRELHYAP